MGPPFCSEYLPHILVCHASRPPGAEVSLFSTAFPECQGMPCQSCTPCGPAAFSTGAALRVGGACGWGGAPARVGGASARTPACTWARSLDLCPEISGSPSHPRQSGGSAARLLQRALPDLATILSYLLYTPCSSDWTLEIQFPYSQNGVDYR